MKVTPSNRYYCPVHGSFRLPIYTFKWLFVAKIYIIYKYRMITIGLQVSKWPFYIFEKKLNCVIDIFKLLFNENIINPRMARYSLKILLICKRRNGFIFFSFRDMQSQIGAKLNFKFYMYFSQIGNMILEVKPSYKI